MTATDRSGAMSTGVAMKAACRVQTTANITLSGTQTINGIAVVADDRVFVKNQTDTAENGIYVVDSSTWTRARDFNGNRDVVCGTIIPVYAGSGTYYQYAVKNTGTIVIGTTELEFITILTV